MKISYKISWLVPIELQLNNSEKQISVALLLKN